MARMIKVTLDTCVIKSGTDGTELEKAACFGKLLDLRARGIIEIAVSNRIIEDMDRDPLGDRWAHEQRIAWQFDRIYAPWRLDIDPLDWSPLAPRTLTTDINAINSVLKPGPYDAAGKGRNNRLWDADHVCAHAIHGRDVFLTYDRGLLRKAPELMAVGVVVRNPLEFIESLDKSSGLTLATFEIKRVSAGVCSNENGPAEDWFPDGDEQLPDGNELVEMVSYARTRVRGRPQTVIIAAIYSCQHVPGKQLNRRGPLSLMEDATGLSGLLEKVIDDCRKDALATAHMATVPAR